MMQYRSLFSATGLALTGVFLLISVAVISAFPRLRIDLTQDNLYTLADGTRVLLVHAAPGKDDGPGLHPGLSDDEWVAALADCDADLVFVGHTHWPLVRQVGATKVVNLGSLSIPFGPDVRASYVLLENDAGGHRIEHRRVAYDIDELLAQMNRLRFPGTAFLTPRFLGEMTAPWG